MDWAAWSRESASLMATRTDELLAHHRIEMGSDYHWDLDAATMVIAGTPFRLVTVGTVAGDSFLWAWANDAIPASAKVGIDQVRQFGVENDLGLLSEPCVPGGLSQAKECLAIAGRVLDARGMWIDQIDAGFILFVLYEPTRH
jgi:hypothetical protein